MTKRVTKIEPLTGTPAGLSCHPSELDVDEWDALTLLRIGPREAYRAYVDDGNLYLVTVGWCPTGEEGEDSAHYVVTVSDERLDDDAVIAFLARIAHERMEHGFLPEFSACPRWAQLLGETTEGWRWPMMLRRIYELASPTARAVIEGPALAFPLEIWDVLTGATVCH